MVSGECVAHQRNQRFATRVEDRANTGARPRGGVRLPQEERGQHEGGDDAVHHVEQQERAARAEPRREAESRRVAEDRNPEVAKRNS